MDLRKLLGGGKARINPKYSSTERFSTDIVRDSSPVCSTSDSASEPATPIPTTMNRS